jgi:hypothetical protein
VGAPAWCAHAFSSASCSPICLSSIFMFCTILCATQSENPEYRPSACAFAREALLSSIRLVITAARFCSLLQKRCLIASSAPSAGLPVPEIPPSPGRTFSPCTQKTFRKARAARGACSANAPLTAPCSAGTPFVYHQLSSEGILSMRQKLCSASACSFSEPRCWKQNICFYHLLSL